MILQGVSCLLVGSIPADGLDSIHTKEDVPVLVATSYLDLNTFPKQNPPIPRLHERVREFRKRHAVTLFQPSLDSASHNESVHALTADRTWAMNLRVSAQHRANPRERTQISEDFDKRGFIPPYVVVCQRSSPNPRPDIPPPFAIRLNARTQLFQLHVHARHVCFPD